MIEDKNNKDKEQVVPKNEEKAEENAKANNITDRDTDHDDIIKVKIGSLGNWVLTILVILIMATAGLTYYLIHSAKKDYDQQYNGIVANITGNMVNETQVDNTNETAENVVTIGNMINTAINEANKNTVSTSDGTNNRKSLNQELVVLYNGLLLDTTKMDEVTLKYVDNTSDNADKYVITYNNYENYAFSESRLGTLSTQIYDGLVKIENVGKIAISEDYEAIPRQIKVVNTIPSVVLEKNAKIAEFDKVKTLIVDLDGNQTDEYILVLANKTTGFSKITLIDSNGTKVADLASIEKSQWKKDAKSEFYLNLNNVEIIDLDNDGIMEIAIEIPHAVGNPTVSLLKYKNGELLGKKDIKCSLIAQ